MSQVDALILTELKPAYFASRQKGHARAGKGTSKAVKAFHSESVEFQPSAERQADSATGQAAAESETEHGEPQQTVLKGNHTLFGSEVCSTVHSTAYVSV